MPTRRSSGRATSRRSSSAAGARGRQRRPGRARQHQPGAHHRLGRRARAFATERHGKYEVAPGRQRREPRRRDDEGRRQPDGLPGGDLALQPQPRACSRPRSASADGGTIMDFLKSIAIAASGLRAQSGRMRVISENIANAEFDRAAPRRRSVPAQDPDLPRRGRPRARRADVVALGRVRQRPDRLPHRSTSRAIRPPTPTATSNIRTSIRWSR